MNKIKKVLGFIAVLAMVASGFAAMASADITSESEAKYSSATIYVPDNYSMTEQFLNVLNTESITITNAPRWVPRNMGFSYYSPGLEFGYSGLKTKKYTLKMWLLERSHWYCASTQICEKTITIDNTGGNNSSGIIRIPEVIDIYNYPTFDWVVRLYDETTQVDWTELYATGTYNKPPQLSLIGSKEAIRNHLLEFTISGTDPDGDGLTYQADNLPSGSSFDPESRTFSWTPTTTGYYTNIRFRVTDDGEGNLYDSEYITIIVREDENQPPTAIIDSITPDPAEQEKDTVSFTGHGTDSDGSVVAYNWRSSIDGQLSNSPSFTKPASDLSVGRHTIYFKVQDDDGAWSTEDTEDLTIEPSANVTYEEKAYLHLYEVMDKYNEFFDVYTDRDAAGNHYIPSGWMGDWDNIAFNDSYTIGPHSGANCIKITYSADFYADNHYIPSGWMGDWNDITFNDSYTIDPHSGANCIKINYSANGSQGSNWSGIYWQDPEHNWGDKIGGFNLTGATELTFWAKGEKGGEKMEFKVGGINRHAYNVYTDKNAANNHYFPSGWYNGATNMVFNDNWMDNPHSGTSCIKVTWNGAAGNDGWKWNGVMWQNPENNWVGDSGYGYNLTDATKLTFWARTDEPGLKVKFLMGYPDDTSGEVSSGWVELYTNWTEYEINLSGVDLSDIAGGFAFVFNDVNDPDPDGCTFYLDDIKYDKVTLHDPDKPYQDSCGPVSSGVITLTNDWTRYAIDLTNENLSRIIGGFGWVANKDNNPDGCTFYIDDVKYEYEDKSLNVYRDAQQNWAGIYWQYPENNREDCSAGGYNLTGATNLSFLAKGANGTEKIEFKIGGIGWDPKTDQQIALYPDSLHPAVSTGVINLTNEWKQHTINLTGKNLSHVIGGFCWVTNTTLNPNGCTFYLDDIKYNKQRLDELRFLVSYETTSASEDKYMKNVAFTYDNALVMLAFMARGSEEDWRRTKILGDCFIYCQNHDRYFSDGRLRNAYQAGDIADYQEKARLPGFWNDLEQKWFEDKGSVGSSTGNMAWIMIALLCYYETTGNTAYLESAEHLGDWIYNNTYDTRYYGGYTGGYEGWGANQTNLSWKSTEHNLDVYVAFMKLYNSTDDSVWQGRAIHAKNFAMSMWNGDGGYFWTGTKDNETINKDVLPADVNTWGIMVLGKEYDAGVKWVEDNCKVTSCSEGCGFEGFDFNNDKDGVWFEGTAHMCIAYQIMNETNKSDDYISEIRKAQTSANNSNEKGIVAACHDGVTTGFDWVYNNRLHIGATSWYIFAEREYNPYWNIKTSEPIPLLLCGDLNSDGKITPADAVIALQMAVRGEWNPVADVSGDRRITSLDALIILQAAAGAVSL